jgi:hypothetical protein
MSACKGGDDESMESSKGEGEKKKLSSTVYEADGGPMEWKGHWDAG